MTVVVTAGIRVKPGLEDIALEELAPVVDLTRAEPGCLAYDLHRSVDDPTLFVLVETWLSDGDLRRHLEMPYVRALGEKGRRDPRRPHRRIGLRARTRDLRPCD